MRDPSGVWVLGLLIAAVVVLTVLHRRHAARVRADRAGLFSDCSGLLEDAVLVRRGLDYPLLQGRRRGHDVRVEPVVDTLSMRTLPVLWLVVTIRGPHNVAERLSVLARVCGTEFYARHSELGQPAPVGPGWPGELSVRSAGGDVATVHPALLERIRGAMADGTVKQVVVSPTSARVVWKCATADSGTYRVTRRVDLSQARVDAQALEEVLTAMDQVLDLPAATPDAASQRAVR